MFMKAFLPFLCGIMLCLIILNPLHADIDALLDLEYYAGVLLNKLHSFQQTQPSFSPVQKEAE